MKKSRGSGHAADLVIADVRDHGVTVKDGHGVRLGANQQTRQPAGFVAKAVKKRVNDQVAIFAV